MPDFLLLKSKVCPRCHCDRVVHFRQCPNCSTMLFTRPIQFSNYENDGGFRNWWVYDVLKGWIHRDAVMVAEYVPNERLYKAPKLDDNYGKTITPEQIQARGGKIRMKGKIKKAPRRYY